MITKPVAQAFEIGVLVNGSLHLFGAFIALLCFEGHEYRAGGSQLFELFLVIFQLVDLV